MHISARYIRPVQKQALKVGGEDLSEMKKTRNKTRSPSEQSGHGGHTWWTRVDTSTSQCNGIINKVTYLRRAYYSNSYLRFSLSTNSPQCLTFTLYPGLRRYGNINQTQIGERNSGFYTILTVVVAAVHSLSYTPIHHV
jgi:hypothetical protein